MLIAVIVLSVLLVIMSYFYATTRINNWHLCQEFWAVLAEKDADYAALEQGRDEESEAYEQQYLSFMETIEGQANAIGSYIEDLESLVKIARRHMDGCLPIVGLEKEDLAVLERIESSLLLSDG